MGKIYKWKEFLISVDYEKLKKKKKRKTRGNVMGTPYLHSKCTPGWGGAFGVIDMTEWTPHLATPNTPPHPSVHLEYKYGGHIALPKNK